MVYPSYLNLFETGDQQHELLQPGKLYAVAQSAHRIAIVTVLLVKLEFADLVQRLL